MHNRAHNTQNCANEHSIHTKTGITASSPTFCLLICYYFISSSCCISVTPTLKVAGSNPDGRTYMKPCNLNGCGVFCYYGVRSAFRPFSLFSAFCRENFRKRRKNLPAKPMFSRLCGLFIVSGFTSGITRFKFTREKFSCGSDSFFLSVSIPVQSCLNIRVARHRLKGIDIKI